MSDNTVGGKPGESRETELWEGRNNWGLNRISTLAADDAEAGADTRVDVNVAVIVMFCVLLMAIHFISGWTFDWG